MNILTLYCVLWNGLYTLYHVCLSSRRAVSVSAAIRTESTVSAPPAPPPAQGTSTSTVGDLSPAASIKSTVGAIDFLRPGYMGGGGLKEQH